VLKIIWIWVLEAGEKIAKYRDVPEGRAVEQVERALYCAENVQGRTEGKHKLQSEETCLCVACTIVWNVYLPNSNSPRCRCNQYNLDWSISMSIGSGCHIAHDSAKFFFWKRALFKYCLWLLHITFHHSAVPFRLYSRTTVWLVG
jgi:hypothetical protein